MVKNIFFKNKKANMTYTEFALIVFSIISIGLILFFINLKISGTQEVIELMQPELTYKFPAVFVHTFLMQEVEKNDTNNLGLNQNKKYFIKDLIWIGSDNAIKLVKNKYRDKYLNEINSNSPKIHDYFKKFVGKNYYNKQDLLQIKKENSLPNLQSEINKNNYFFYLKTKGGELVLIYFN